MIIDKKKQDGDMLIKNSLIYYLLLGGGELRAITIDGESDSVASGEAIVNRIG